MKSLSMRAGAVSLALLLAGCGGGTVENSSNSGGEGAAPPPANGPQAASAADDSLVMPPSWMPADWDRNVYPQAGESGMDAQNIRRARQKMLATVPFTLWAVANGNPDPERFSLVWTWYTAIRSCERGVQMSEDLTGEFSNRQRGEAAIARARADLGAWAATQPREMTLYFTARLGQWEEETGAFSLQQAGKATTLRPKDIARVDDLHDGATVELGNERAGQSISRFQASLSNAQCVGPGGRQHRFERLSQWWVLFGDVEPGAGGLLNYRSRAYLPPIAMSREAAAAFAQRNPQRAVEVAVTFEPSGSAFDDGRNQSYIRARYRQVTITDALDGSVLASRTYPAGGAAPSR